MKDNQRRTTRAALWLPGLVVAIGAAVATAHGLYLVALAADVPPGIAWLYPLITDGLALVAYASTARLTGAGARYAWGVVVLAAGLSGLAQASYLAGGSTLTAGPALRFGVGAWPAVAAAVVAHLLYLLATDRTGQPDRAAATVGTAAAQDTAAAVELEPPDTTAVQAPPNPGQRLDGLNGGHRMDALDSRPPWALDTAADSPAELDGPSRGRSALDRAADAARDHHTRAGAWPTARQLAALAAVSRGTAATALKTLRTPPSPLHVVPTDTPASRNR